MTTTLSTTPITHAQNLASGTIGRALLAIERAHHDLAPWNTANSLLRECTTALVISESAGASLYFGAPAVGLALHTANNATGLYERALEQIDAEVIALTHRRLALAHARIGRGAAPRLSEFDFFYGLTGLGVYHLQRGTAPAALRVVLTYLVRLTEELPDGRPGWWTDLDPSGRISSNFPQGHGNAGTAHGVSGPLALLALAYLDGTVVPGHLLAISRITSWLDSIRRGTDAACWWPEWTTTIQDDGTAADHSVPTRPSWCYGVPGQARAQQLAALALGDADRQRRAEEAMLQGLRRTALLNESGLCHGITGALLLANRMADDAPAGFFDHGIGRLLDRAKAAPTDEHDGFLNGEAGVQLALLADRYASEPSAGWDAFLLAQHTPAEDGPR
ncbi:MULTISPECIES: lanthionine synthetase C family protein [Streptacidiphilus]|uniref:Lanthionine synthetase C family protein n=1 Tax=Streptacidiphilus cavernicola TaxID=3342716 RepID=A0ABV6V0B6_9ACTN|nr:lanthionine synthetase C family protein [Streptacidiphilus jeojiense]